MTDSDGNIIIDVGNKDTWKFKKMQSKYFVKKSPPVVFYLFFFPPSLFVVRAIGWRSRKTLKKIHLNSCASSPLSFFFYLFQNSVLSSLSPYTPTFFQLKKHPGVSLFSFLVLRHPSPQFFSHLNVFLPFLIPQPGSPAISLKPLPFSARRTSWGWSCSPW